MLRGIACMNNENTRVAIIGGSVGGLAAALELRRSAKAEVAVYERSAGQMQARGAGVVMQPDVEWLLAQYGTKAEDVSVQLKERIQLEQSGQSFRQRAPQLMTAWDTLYNTLRKPLQDSCYRQDSELVELRQEDGNIFVRFLDGYETSSDFLVAADGVNSTCRSILVGKAAADYAGYVAWRGLENENNLPVNLVRQLADRFTHFYTPGMQMLCYLVPGSDGSTQEGQRRVNWVWYVNTPRHSLNEILTGESGRTYKSFVPKGEVNYDAAQRLRKLANTHLPPVFKELVLQSELFIQPVQDVASQSRLHGHCALIGDAAGTVRPHTASGTSKAFADATLLAMTLNGWNRGNPLPIDRLHCWERQRQSELNRLSSMGIQLAASSGLGVVAAPQPWALNKNEA